MKAGFKPAALALVSATSDRPAGNQRPSGICPAGATEPSQLDFRLAALEPAPLPTIESPPPQSPRLPIAPTPTRKPATVHRLRSETDPSRDRDEALRDEDRALVASLLAGHPNAPAKFFDRYGRYVERLLYRVVGRDGELEDLLHEVFAEALDNMDRLKDGGALRAWLTRITVFRARSFIRKKTRGRWLVFLPHHEVPEVRDDRGADRASAAMDRVYVVLEQIKADDRIAFTLRELHQMTLEETALACGVSLATVKRRIARGKKRFMHLAASEPLLRERLERGQERQERGPEEQKRGGTQ